MWSFDGGIPERTLEKEQKNIWILSKQSKAGMMD